MHIDYNLLIDATQDDCPIPTIRTKEALDRMAHNEILKLVTSKEGTIRNIKTFVRNNNCELIKETKSKEGYVFYLKKI
jgi:tRNA 2-thiouridine synthesizing protein A